MKYLFFIGFFFMSAQLHSFDFISTEDEKLLEESTLQADEQSSFDVAIDNFIKDMNQKFYNSLFKIDGRSKIIHSEIQKTKPKDPEEFYYQSLAYDLIRNFKKFDNHIYIVVNQFTNNELFDFVMYLKKLNSNIQINFVVPYENIIREFFVRKQIERKFQDCTIYWLNGKEAEGTLHMKYILTDAQVMSGSPNFTTSGLKYNLETIASLEDRESLYLFKLYTNYLIYKHTDHVTYIKENSVIKTFGSGTDIKYALGGDDVDFSQFKNFDNEIKFNDAENDLRDYTVNILENPNYKPNTRICFAPICKPNLFIQNEIKNAEKSIKIQVFILDYNSIVQKLLDIKKIMQNNINIQLAINGETYDTTPSIFNAVDLIKLYNIDVQSIYPKKSSTKYQPINRQNSRNIETLHDNRDVVLHDKNYIIDNKTSIIGSGNLTTSTIDSNKNAEVYIAIDDIEISNILSNYFDAVWNYEDYKMPYHKMMSLN